MARILTYNVDDIFQDIENDKEHVLMKIPPEICEDLEWEPGDTLSIEIIEEVPCISITKVKNG